MKPPWPIRESHETDLIFLALLAFPYGPSVAAEQHPKFVLLMGDDHGWEQAGYNGHPHVKAPVLDEIAAAGLRFDRSTPRIRVARRREPAC